MNEFEKQVNEALLRDIQTFNSTADYDDIRILYKNNFKEINQLINKFGHSQAIEDISELDSYTKSKVIQHRQILQQINRAIKDGKLNKNGIK